MIDKEIWTIPWKNCWQNTTLQKERRRFPIVPISQRYEFFGELLQKNSLNVDDVNDFMLFTTIFCMNRNCCRFETWLYEQNKLISMDNPFFPILANVFMNRIEMGTSKKLQYFLEILLGYVYDVFAVFDSSILRWQKIFLLTSEKLEVGKYLILHIAISNGCSRNIICKIMKKKIFKLRIIDVSTFYNENRRIKFFLVPYH